MPNVVRIVECPGECGNYKEIHEDGREFHFIGGYADSQIRAGKLPEYMKPGFVEPGMGGLPKRHPNAPHSMEYEPSFIVALRHEEMREAAQLNENTGGDGI